MQEHEQPSHTGACSEQADAQGKNSDPLSALLDDLGGIARNARRYAAAVGDGIRVRVRMYMVAAVAALLIGLFALIGSVALLMRLIDGTAGALSAAAGGREWVGNVGVSVIGFGLMILGGLYFKHKTRAAFLRRRTLNDRHRRSSMRTLAKLQAERRRNHVRSTL